MSQNPHDDTSPTTRIPEPEPMPGTTTWSNAPHETDNPAEPTTPAGTTGATPDGATRTMTVPERETVTVETPRRQARMRTVVMGVVLLAIAVLTNLKITTSVDFRLGTVVLALMIGCGVLLIVGASRRE